MRTVSRSAVAGLLVWSCLLSPCLPAEGQGAETPVRRLDLDRLYSPPWVTGTAPESPQWAPDSRRVAFLWNEEGTNFRDVWVADVQDGKPARVTFLRPPAVRVPPGAALDARVAEEVMERDHGVSSVVWAPDGRQLVYALHGRLYAVVPGGSPSRLDDTEETQSDPVAAPRADHIAYRCGGDLCVADLAGPRPIARKVYSVGFPDVAVESLYWAPDALQLAFVESDERPVALRGIPDYLATESRLVPVRRAFPGEPAERRRVGVVRAAGGEVRWMDTGQDPETQIFSVNWSPDARRLLIDTSDVYIKDRRLLLADAATGQRRELVRESDPNNVTAEWWADWSPDGKDVYYTSDREDDYHLYVQPVSGGKYRRLTSGRFAVFGATVSRGDACLYVVANRERPEERQVYRVALTGGPMVRVTSAAGHHEALPSPDGRWLADVYSNDTTPPDLYLVPTHPPARGARDPRRITHAPLAEFDTYRWVAARYVEFPNVNDGTTLHARLTLPPDFDPARKYPAILGSVYSNTAHNRWGGRIYHPTWAIDQFLAQQGYVIMNVDISGSSGHGKAFRQRIREDYGGVDVDDLYSGVRYLIGQGYVDEHRVGLWGSSYGGLLTTMSLFRRPGVYQAGVAGAPATSLYHATTGEMRTMMAPQDHPVQYANASAFLRSGALADHLLIIHGMRDDTVLFKDSVTLVQRLILQGGPVDFVVLPDAPHGWDTQGLAQTRFAFHKLVDYFRTYLGEGPDPE